jgi:hypothetical protein
MIRAGLFETGIQSLKGFSLDKNIHDKLEQIHETRNCAPYSLCYCQS